MKPIKTTYIDSLWSKAVKVRADYKCEYCGRTDTLNSHHIFSKSNRAVRWDLANGICLCALHHALGNFSAHKAPLEFAEWIRNKRGEEWYQELRAKSNTIVKLSNANKVQIASELRKEI